MCLRRNARSRAEVCSRVAQPDRAKSGAPKIRSARLGSRHRLVPLKQRLARRPVLRLVSVQPRAETMAQPELEELRRVPPEAEYLPQRLGCRPGRLRPAARARLASPSSPAPFRSTRKDLALAAP